MGVDPISTGAISGMTDTTPLLRQIHPTFVQDGRVTSQAFRPTQKDEELLSVYDGDRIEPEQAYRHYTLDLEYASCGCMAVTVLECVRVGVSARPEPTPFPEHAVIDFTGLNEGKKKTVSKRLRSFAEERGWLYRG